MNEQIILFTVCLAASLLMCAMITRILIPKLKSLKMGQKILDIGPRWHKGKEGTPTMGGLAMIITAFVVATGALAYCVAKQGIALNLKGVFTLIMALLYGAIGIIDDRVKLLKKQKS